MIGVQREVPDWLISPIEGPDEAVVGRAATSAPTAFTLEGADPALDSIGAGALEPTLPAFSRSSPPILPIITQLSVYSRPLSPAAVFAALNVESSAAAIAATSPL